MELLTEPSKNGVAYLLLAISFLAIYRLYSQLIAEKDARRQDAERVREAVTEPLQNIQRLLDLIFNEVTKKT